MLNSQTFFQEDKHNQHLVVFVKHRQLISLHKKEIKRKENTNTVCNRHSAEAAMANANANTHAKASKRRPGAGVLFINEAFEAHLSFNLVKSNRCT